MLESLLSGITQDVLKSLLFLVGGFALDRGIIYYQNIKGRKHWLHILDKSPIYVIATTKKLTDKPRSTPKVSLGEMQGYAQLDARLRRYKVVLNLYTSTEVNVAMLAKGHYIYLGGPKANSYTKGAIEHFERRTGRQLPVQYSEEHGCLVAGHIRYAPSYDDKGFEKSDFGVLARLKIDTYNGKDYYGIFAFGNHSWGTLGVINSLLDDSTMSNIAIQAPGEFLALLEYSIDRTVPKFTRVEKVFKL